MIGDVKFKERFICEIIEKWVNKIGSLSQIATTQPQAYVCAILLDTSTGLHTTWGWFRGWKTIYNRLRILSDTNSSLKSLAGMSSMSKKEKCCPFHDLGDSVWRVSWRQRHSNTTIHATWLSNWRISSSIRTKRGLDATPDSVWTATKTTGKTRQNSSRNDDLRKAPKQIQRRKWRIKLVDDSS